LRRFGAFRIKKQCAAAGTGAHKQKPPPVKAGVF